MHRPLNVKYSVRYYPRFHVTAVGLLNVLPACLCVCVCVYIYIYIYIYISTLCVGKGAEMVNTTL